MTVRKPWSRVPIPSSLRSLGPYGLHVLSSYGDGRGTFGLGLKGTTPSPYSDYIRYETLNPLEEK